MNPLSDDTAFAGAARRFDPPWGEVICVVTLDDGSWGIGLTGFAGLTEPLITDYVGPMLVGEPIDDLDRLWDVMSQATGAYLGRGAAVGYAMSAIDLALVGCSGSG